MAGIFCVSLDAEFFWGVHDFTTIEQYGQNVIEAREMAIPGMLDLFKKYNIHATWAFVGGACAKTREELEEFAPPKNLQPSYEKKILSPYNLIEQMEEDDETPSVYLAGKELERILRVPNQEIGTHTFSHYFCSEAGQTVEQFEADIMSSIKIARSKGIDLNSIVYPKNQIREEYLEKSSELGIRCYRGIEENWIYNSKLPVFVQRVLRFADAYLPISGANCHKPTYVNGLCNIRGSRIFKPYMKSLAFIESIKILRIKGQMKYAAKHDLVFHLWWHPHNFGKNTYENLKNLEAVLMYFRFLEQKYKMKSRNMGEIMDLYEESPDGK